MDKKRVFELVTRLNEIRVEQNKLDMEHNEIVQELWEMIPTLKGDPNIELKEESEYGREKNISKKL